jgi:ADP-heptose:LPS heptosyltransferase
VQVLLVRAGALGDLLLLRRTIAALRAAGHSVSLLAPEAGDVLVSPVETDHRIAWEAAETALVLAGEAGGGPLAAALDQADAVLAFTRSAVLVDALRQRTRQLLVHDPTPPGGIHASLWLAGALRALGIDDTSEPPPLRFSADERSRARAITGELPPGFLAIHPGSGSPSKNWPARSFALLAERLAAGRRWLLLLGPAEDDTPWTDVRDAVVARGLPLRGLGAVLSQAGLYVGNDSGVSHLAAASGAATLAIFGPTDPSLWAPTGRSVCCVRATDLSALDVDEVEREARSILPTSAASGLPFG